MSGWIFIIQLFNNPIKRVVSQAAFLALFQGLPKVVELRFVIFFWFKIRLIFHRSNSPHATILLYSLLARSTSAAVITVSIAKS